MPVAQNQVMQRGHYVFGYEAEPAAERPTGFGQTNFWQSGPVTLTTMPAPWTVSEHSTFDEPSRSIDKVHALRRQRNLATTAGIAAIVLLAAAAVASVVTLAFRS